MSDQDQLLERIAASHLRIDTLQTRHSDSLDFHDVAVWNIRTALQAAFIAGVEHAAKASAVEDPPGAAAVDNNAPAGPQPGL